LSLVGRALYVAMAGPHQIWRLDLDARTVSLFAGTGREARADGRRLGDIEDETVAAFAQPSGLAADDGKTLYVADAESNVIRAVALEGDAKGEGEKSEGAKMKTASLSSTIDEVRTLAGGDLFEFGDRDGSGDDARLQHPLGLALEGSRLFIADTYNHKIKVLDPRTRKVSTFAGTGRPGQADGERASFYEPGGLSVARGRLYVADTNNHAVRVVDLSTGKTSTLAIRGLLPPAPDAGAAAAESDSTGPNAEESKLPAQRVAASSDATLTVDVALPEGYHLNPSAPQRYHLEVSEGPQHVSIVSNQETGSPWRDKTLNVVRKELRLPLRLSLRTGEAGASELRVRLSLFYCREDNTGTCRIKTLAWRVPVEVTADASAPREISLRAKVE
jgi:sugar lactone lactonase YvrE